MKLMKTSLRYQLCDEKLEEAMRVSIKGPKTIDLDIINFWKQQNFEESIYVCLTF